MSADGNESSSLLNTAVPIAFLAFLNVLGLYMLVTDGPPIVLAMLAVIAVTVLYIWWTKPFSRAAESRPSLLSPELSSDLTKTVEIGARMDQIVADIEQLKRREGGANIEALKRDVAARMEQLAAEIREIKQESGSIEAADIAQAVNARFDRLMAEIDALKQAGGAPDLTELRQEIEKRLAQIAAQVEDVKQVGGGVDAQDIQREVEARLDAIRTEIEDLRDRGGAADVDGIKEQLATLQVYQTSAALSEKDRIDRISAKVSALQRVPDEVARLKENQRLSETERNKIAAAEKDLEEQVAALQARLAETASIDRVQAWMGELRQDMESIESGLKDIAHASDLKALNDELAPQIHSLQKLVIELQDPTKIKELLGDIEKIKERLPALAAANDVEMLAEHVKQQVRELSGVIDETDQTEAVQQLRAKLTQEIAALRKEMEKRAAASDMEEAIDAVKTQMADISARLDGVTAKELEERFAGLKNEVRKVKEALAGAPKTQDVQKLIADIRAEAAEQAHRSTDGLAAAAESRKALADGIAGLQKEIAGLREKTQEIAVLRTCIDEAATVEDVKKWLAELRETVGAVEGRLGETAPAEDLKALKDELTPQIRVLQKAVGEMQDPKKLKDLAAEIEAIAGRLAEFAGASDLDAVAKDVRQRIDDLAKALKDADQTQAVRDLRAKIQQGLDDLKKQLAAAAKRTEVEETAASIREKIGKMEEAIAGARANAAAEIGQVKDELHAEGEAREGVSKAVSELRDNLSELGETAGEIAALKARMDEAAVEEKVQAWLEELRSDLADAREALDGATRPADLKALRDDLARQIGALRGSVDDLSTRLDHIATEELDERLSGIRDEMEHLKKELAAASSKMDVEKLVAEIQAETSAVSERVDDLGVGRLKDQLSRIEGEVAKLSEALGKASTSKEVQDLVAGMRRETASLSARLDALHMTEAHQQLARLRADFDSLRQALASAVTGEEIQKLAERIHAETSAVSARVEDIAAKEFRTRLSEMKAEIDALRESLSAAADSAEVADIRKEIDGLTDRLEGLASVDDVKAAAADLAPRIAALQQAVEEMKDSARLDGLAAEVAGIQEQLAAFADSSEVEARAKEVKQQIAELRKILDESDHAQAFLDLQTRVRQEIDDLQKQLKGRPTAKAVEKATEEMRSQVAQLASRIDRIAEAKLEDRISAIREEVGSLKEEMASAIGREDVEEIVGRIREQTAALADRVEGLIDDTRAEVAEEIKRVEGALSARPAAPASAEVPTDIDNLREQVSELSNLPTEIKQLWERLAELKWGIKPEGEAEATAPDTRALERTVARLREDLDALAARPTGGGAGTSGQELARLWAEIATITARMDSIRETVKQLDAGSGGEEIRSEIARITSRLQELSAHPDGITPEEMEERLAGLRNELAEMKEGLSAAPTDAAMQEVASRIRTEIADRLAQMEDDLRAEREALEEAARSVGELRDRMERADEAAREIASVRQRLDETPSLDKVQGWMGDLNANIETLEKKLAHMATIANVYALREEIAALERRMDEMKEPERLDRLSEEVESIKNRLTVFASAGDIEAAAGTMKKQVDELKEMLGETDLRQAIEDLRAGFTARLDDLARQIEAHPAEGEVAPLAEAIKQQVAALSSRVTELAEEELRPKIFELSSEISALRETVSSAAGTAQMKGVLDEARSDVMKQLDDLREALSAESSAREDISADMAEVRKKLETVSQAAGEINQLWERLAEMKWGLTPAGERPEPAYGVDDALDGMREEMAEMSARLAELNMEEARTQLRDLREEVNRLTENISAMKEASRPEAMDQPPPAPRREAEFSERITEVTSLRQISREETPITPQVGAAGPTTPETKSLVPAAGEAIAGKIFHISDPAVQSLMAMYSSVVASMDRGLVAARDHEEDFDPEGIWQGAQALIAAQEEDARILAALMCRPYPGESRISGHSVNVLLLSLRAAGMSVLSPGERAALGKAALFHDIGMMRLPQEMFGDARQASEEYQKELMRYPEHSARLLKKLGDDLLCALVLQAHEREDGAGFPARLTGPQIHPLAKLLHVADIFDALIHGQGPSIPQPFEAIKILQNSVNTSLNAEAFRQFRDAIGAFPVGTIVELNTRERAKVIAVEPRETLRPAVAVLTDSNGNILSRGRFLDLQRSAGLFMARALVDEELAERARDIL
ncbi:MAG: HD domain-containing phosphohydrolase [Planctomycetota bacterium]